MYDGKMLETGYPRNDILYLKDKEKEDLTLEIKKELGIPVDKKVILYAPTWRDEGRHVQVGDDHAGDGADDRANGQNDQQNRQKQQFENRNDKDCR